MAIDAKILILELSCFLKNYLKVTFEKHNDSRILVGKTKLWKNLYVFLQTLSRNQLSLSVFSQPTCVTSNSKSRFWRERACF